MKLIFVQFRYFYFLFLSIIYKWNIYKKKKNVLPFQEIMIFTDPTDKEGDLDICDSFHSPLLFYFITEYNASILFFTDADGFI